MAEYPEDETDDYAADIAEGEAPELTDASAERPADKLLSFLDQQNLVEMLDETKLSEIAAKAIGGYELDESSRDPWRERTDEAMELAMLIAGDEKDFPYKGAANVKNPLITTAALQFNARAYPAIVQGDRVAKSKVNGHDPDGQKAKRAERVSEHMSWQLLSEMPEWEEDTDRLLMIVAVTGSIFRKVYYDPTLGRKCSRLITADKMVVNYRARSLKDAPRLSEVLYLYPYEIQERIRDGRFIEFEYGEAQPDGEDDKDYTDQRDEQAPHKFIEQHRLLDLDGDEYPEPYIVTVHIASQKVCRIVPNYSKDSVRVTDDGKVAAVRRRDYYVQYPFMPSADGGIYGMGLGWLLKDTNEAINTTMNQMLDAGTLANTQGGFISSSAGLRDKRYYFSRGEFKVVNTGGVPLNNAIMPLQFSGPSDVLFKLLGLLIEMGKEVANTKDVLLGETGGKVMQPTTVMALVEQGMTQFNSIFKRTYRALKNEFRLHAELNHEHLTPEAYNAFFDGPEMYDPKADYDMSDFNITPVSDPRETTPTQKLAKAQVVREIAGQGKPWINYQEVDKMALEAAEVEDTDRIFNPPAPPDPLAEAVKQLSVQELFEKVIKLRSESIKNVADAESKEAGDQLAILNQFLSTLQAGHAMETQDNAQIPGGPGGVPGMEGQPGNPMGAGPAPGAGAGNGGGPVGPVVEPGAGQPGGMGGAPADMGAPAGAM